MRRAVGFCGLLLMVMSAWGSGASAAPVGSVTLFSGFRPARGPQNLVSGPDGNLWFTEADAIGRITPQGQMTEFTRGLTHLPAGPVESDFRSVIVSGPDGNLWFTAVGAIGRITPRGQITEYAANRQPGWLVRGPDGNLWFSDSGCLGATNQQCVSAIARITPQGQVKEFPNIAADYLAAGPDGNVWFFGGPVQTLSGPTANPPTPHLHIGRITPQGQLTEIDLGPPYPPSGLVSLPDGNMWFSVGGSIGRITPHGQITRFSSCGGSQPAWGADGNIWCGGGGGVTRISPQGQVTRFSNGLVNPQRGPNGDVAAGADGNVWFTEGSSEYVIPPQPGIGRITPQGRITEYTRGLQPFPIDLVAGPDSNLWFLDNGSIGRIIAGPPVGQPSVGHATVAGTAARVPLACAGSKGASCVFTLTLSATDIRSGGHVIAVTAAKKTTSLVLGSRTVRLSGGTRKTVAVSLNHHGWHLLSSLHRLTVKLAISATGNGKTTVTRRQTVTFTVKP